MNSRFEYMAPEMIKQPITHQKVKDVKKCDSWAIGCIFVELMTGEKAFKTIYKIINLKWNYDLMWKIDPNFLNLLERIFVLEESKRLSVR